MSTPLNVRISLRKIPNEQLEKEFKLEPTHIGRLLMARRFGFGDHQPYFTRQACRRLGIKFELIKNKK